MISVTVATETNVIWSQLHSWEDFHTIHRLKDKTQEGEALTRLLAVAISAFRMSGSYLLEEDDLEFTAGKESRREEKRAAREDISETHISGGNVLER